MGFWTRERVPHPVALGRVRTSPSPSPRDTTPWKEDAGGMGGRGVEGGRKERGMEGGRDGGRRGRMSGAWREGWQDAGREAGVGAWPRAGRRPPASVEAFAEQVLHVSGTPPYGLGPLSLGPVEEKHRDPAAAPGAGWAVRLREPPGGLRVALRGGLCGRESSRVSGRAESPPAPSRAWHTPCAG